jgi:hypothetical protein
VCERIRCIRIYIKHFGQIPKLNRKRAKHDGRTIVWMGRSSIGRSKGSIFWCSSQYETISAMVNDTFNHFLLFFYKIWIKYENTMDDDKTITECKKQVVALRTYQNLQRLKVSFTIAEIVSYCEEHQNIDPLLLPIEDRQKINYLVPLALFKVVPYTTGR